MHINGTSHVHGPQAVNAPHRARVAQPPANTTPAIHGADELDISQEAQILSRLGDVPEMRLDRIAEIRAQIESGVYETDEKLSIALDRLLDEISA